MVGGADPYDQGFVAGAKAQRRWHLHRVEELERKLLEAEHQVLLADARVAQSRAAIEVMARTTARLIENATTTKD